MLNAQSDNGPGRHLHLSGLYGVAGDMVLAALVDLGADGECLEGEFRRLEVGVKRLTFAEVMRAGMRGRQMLIVEGEDAGGRPAPDNGTDSGPATNHACPGDQHQKHAADCTSEHPHPHDHHHDSHRHLKDMLAIVNRSDASRQAKERAVRALRALAEAEGRIHGKPVDQVHFHEISGIDTIVDVLGTCMAVEMLGIASITASTITTGHGTLHCAHGTFTVPAPATLEIIARAGIPCQPGDVEAELLTPTGAALLAVLVDEFGVAPPMTPERIGYGAGTFAAGDCLNLLQATLGQRIAVVA
ncbi:MAG: LarC family nickel insertion protein [Phycisphaerae bacterium]